MEIKVSLNTLNNSLKLPVIVAPMFLISNPHMVIKACEAGVVGSFPALNARSASILDEWMITIKQGLKELQENKPSEKIAPWAVNIICHRPHNQRYDEDLALIEKHQPPIVITSLGDPSPIANIVHSYGGLVFSDVINPAFAKKAMEKGSDGLILITNGAGGHGGTLNPFAFLQEVRSFWDGPIILGGGLSKGEEILAAQVMGADYVYMGTRFIVAKESGAVEEYKEMVVNSTSADIVYTSALSGISANFLIPSLLKYGIDPNSLPKEGKIDFPTSKAWKDLWSAGQGVGSVHKEEPIEKIIQNLTEQYEEAKNRVKSDSFIRN